MPGTCNTMARQLSQQGLRHGRFPPRPILAGTCAALLALGAHAASVQESTDLLQRAAGAPVATGGKTLERALEVDTNTGQRNLDLLLEARGADEAAAAVPQRAGEPPAKRQTLKLPPPQVPVAMSSPDGNPPPPLGLQTPEMAGAADTAGLANRREWLGGGSAGSVSGQSAGQGFGDFGSSRAAGQAASHGDPGRLPEVVREALRFLREQRYWLLGGMALLAVVVAGLQAYARRP